MAQGERENRSIDQTLDIGWRILATLPRSELYRVSEETLARRFGKDGSGGT